MKPIDLLVKAEIVLPSPHQKPIRGGAVAIDKGIVVDVGPYDELSRRYSPQDLMNRLTGLVIPGLLNTHTHIPMTILRGIADDLPLKSWLEEHIFPAEAKLTPELVSLGTELGCAEMIRCGTTGFLDMYLFEHTVAKVVDKVGMRAWLGEGIFDFPTPAFPSGEEALIETERLLKDFKEHPRITITVDPHTPYTCRPELLKKSLEVARRHDALIVTHLSETQWEEQEIRKRFGCSASEHLASLGLFDHPLLAAHCVWLNKSDISLLSKKGVCVSHCPESNLKLGSGISPIPDLIEAGITITLGTDGAASNNDLDLMSEMDTAAKLPKGLRKDPTLVSAEQALSMSTIWAAKALRRNDLGELSPGKRADLVVIELDQVHMRPCYNPVSHVVYVARSGDVKDVLVDGRPLMKNGMLTTIDEDELLFRVKRFRGLV